MTNPYSVLGINASATEDQIKDAYRKLALKYSESTDYTADPLAESNDQKMDELNAAYDQIMAERRSGGTQSSSVESYTEPVYETANDYDSASQPHYADIRTHLQNGDTITAEQRLLAIDSSLRGAEWNFLMGCVCKSKGWLDEAYRYFSAAASMEPRNSEYAAAYNSLNRQRSEGSSSYNPYRQASSRSNDCMGDDTCSTACNCLCLYSLCSSCCCGGR